ncbi:hypothetical protein DFH29DRAFT_877671 [Suillus ampliporus]|nr:hypothetical protein DFH29DRAFT_877671 [Suillus ampliporus]
MATPSSPSSAITAPLDYHETAVMFAKIATETMTCHSALLHYDSTLKSMTEWCWPDDDKGQKVPLLNFEKYRDEHKFRYLCCLCASSSKREAYTEAAVYLWRDKATNKTYWNARCAYDRLKIDKYYDRSSLVTFNYPLRAYCKAMVLLMDCPEEHDKPCSIQLEWTWREQTELMAKLDSSIGDGIMRAEFCILFKCCKRCKLCQRHCYAHFTDGQRQVWGMDTTQLEVRRWPYWREIKQGASSIPPQVTGTHYISSQQFHV